ncbi:phage tail protein [Campylobacter curvus]|uniref:phage tail protein n=1 Tax=Campylobacter curvus TaxID=200 RepID=UPI0014700173|nr:phage tail protein [Campylobacter curvus]
MKQYTLLTASGINKLLKTASDGSRIALKEVVVSDFEGELSEQTTSIPNEKYRGAINAITIDENDNNILDVDAIIPPEVGGFYIKTAGIYCDDGSLFAVARLADTYKPLLNEGSSKDITLNFKLQISNANESIILKVDNNVVLATRKWSDATFLKKTDKIDAYTKKESDNKFALITSLPELATETKAGTVKIKNSITGQQEDVAVSEKAVAGIASIGINQTWQDVTQERQIGITYTNTTDRPIMVSITTNDNLVELLVNGIKAAVGNDGSNALTSLCAIIPNKATYVLKGSTTLYHWAELR